MKHSLGIFVSLLVGLAAPPRLSADTGKVDLKTQADAAKSAALAAIKLDPDQQDLDRVKAGDWAAISRLTQKLLDTKPREPLAISIATSMLVEGLDAKAAAHVDTDRACHAKDEVAILQAILLATRAKGRNETDTAWLHALDVVEAAKETLDFKEGDSAGTNPKCTERFVTEKRILIGAIGLTNSRPTPASYELYNEALTAKKYARAAQIACRFDLDVVFFRRAAELGAKSGLSSHKSKTVVLSGDRSTFIWDAEEDLRTFGSCYSRGWSKSRLIDE